MALIDVVVTYHSSIKGSSRSSPLRMRQRVNPNLSVFKYQSKHVGIGPSPCVLDGKAPFVVPGEFKFIGREYGNE
jgi:hypothetical protein